MYTVDIVNGALGQDYVYGEQGYILLSLYKKIITIIITIQ
jgi:hypothetical protein